MAEPMDGEGGESDTQTGAIGRNAPPTSGTEAAAAPRTFEITASRRTIIYPSLIPPPDILRAYDEAVPGAAKSILNLYKEQAKHRMGLEDRVIRNDIARTYLGWASATAVSVMLIGMGGFLIHDGHDVAGTTLATSNVVALAAIFLFGADSRRREREANSRLRDAAVPRQPDQGQAESAR